MSASWPTQVIPQRCGQFRRINVTDFESLMKGTNPNKVLAFATEQPSLWGRSLFTNGVKLQKTPFQLNPFPSEQPEHARPAVELLISLTAALLTGSYLCDGIVVVGHGEVHTHTHTHSLSQSHTHAHARTADQTLAAARGANPAVRNPHATHHPLHTFRLNRVANNVIKSTLSIADDPLHAYRHKIYCSINISK